MKPTITTRIWVGVAFVQSINLANRPNDVVSVILHSSVAFLAILWFFISLLIEGAE